MARSSGNRGRPRAWGPWLGTLLLAVVLLAGVVFVATIRFGWVQGEEFSPRSFRRRLFFYAELPLFGVQVLPIDHQLAGNELADYLKNHKLLSLPKNRPDRWDLAWARRGDSPVVDGNAQILCRYLDAEDAESKRVWLEWTRENREAAKTFWEHVARLAEMELYLLIPELFAVIPDATDGPSAERLCRESLVPRLIELAKIETELQNHDAAAELYTEVLRLDPDHPEATQGKLQSTPGDRTDLSR